MKKNTILHNNDKYIFFSKFFFKLYSNLMNQLFTNNTYGSMSGYIPYGGNFVDILFKHLLERGLTGMTVMTIFNLYLYLSLDKIKELMKWLNENIQDYFKTKVYTY